MSEGEVGVGGLWEMGGETCGAGPVPDEGTSLERSRNSNQAKSHRVTESTELLLRNFPKHHIVLSSFIINQSFNDQ